MASVNQITQIPTSEWPHLRDLFKEDWPSNILPYHLIQNYMNWLEKDPQYVAKNVQISCLNGDWSDGTFIVLEGYQLFLYTLNDNHERLVILLSHLPRNREYLCCTVYERHFPVIQKLLARTPEFILKSDLMAHMYFLPKEQAATLELNTPDGIRLEPMYTDDHAATVDSVYPLRLEGLTKPGFKKLMRLNPNLGAFTKENKLVAWCLLYQSGPLNALQVLDDGNKRRGLGSLVVKAMAKLLADKGMDTFACIVAGNMPSLTLFQKLGFYVIDQVHLITIAPKNDK